MYNRLNEFAKAREFAQKAVSTYQAIGSRNGEGQAGFVPAPRLMHSHDDFGAGPGQQRNYQRQDTEHPPRKNADIYFGDVSANRIGEPRHEEQREYAECQP